MFILTDITEESGRITVTVNVRVRRRLGKRALREPLEWSALMATLPASKERRRDSRLPSPSLSCPSPRTAMLDSNRSFMEADRWRRSPLPLVRGSHTPSGVATKTSRVDPESRRRRPFPIRARRDRPSPGTSRMDSGILRRYPRMLRSSCKEVGSGWVSTSSSQQGGSLEMSSGPSMWVYLATLTGGHAMVPRPGIHSLHAAHCLHAHRSIDTSYNLSDKGGDNTLK
ncbi:hypothetical protein E2C01_010040 [Portunus trituberculatus]|uniref:Uncharacterized protein n=1 Tax=Portunus trituberculatus TaxID=210409 RepID=A0A5B7D7B1_PORTR|nr:hypothetical protein [Portunus trituberculatus]